MSLFGPPNIEKLKAKKDVQGLIKALRYQKDHQVRRDAAETLSVIRDSRTVEPLIAALGDKNKSVRYYAASGLRNSGDPRALEPLIAALKDENREVRWVAVEFLGLWGGPLTVEPLIAALKDEEYDVRKQAILAVGKIEEPRAVKALGAIIKDDDEDKQCRLDAIYYIHRIKDPIAVETLIDALGFVNGNWRINLVQALGEIGDTRAVEPLLKLLVEPLLTELFEDIQIHAVDALEKMGWQPDMGAYGAAYWIVKQEPEKCVEIGAPALKLLIAAINHRHSFIRRVAAEALVTLYQSDKLTEEQKSLILNKRQNIVRCHKDKYNDCSIHTDNGGIGKKFPV